MTCSVPGCKRKAASRGWCSMHYQRWFRHGSPDVVLRSGAPRHRVKHGTMNEYKNYGCRCDLCKRAWAEWYAVQSKARRRALGACEIEGCDIGQYAKGLCKPHYERQRTGQPMDAPLHQHPGAWVAE